MNVSRFQIALNHEDPLVIIAGLNSFSNQILNEHDAVYAFGYNGRSINSLLLSSASNILHPYYSKYNEMPIGLLLSYLQSSPQIEELFVLWNLNGYDINKDLCSSHMICLASILFCAHKDEVFCNYVINRIISEYCKSILTQLGSGNQNIVHSTLGLCIAMARVSKQYACDTYQKIMISNNLFATLLQRGKTVTWPNNENESDNNVETISTDSRLLIIIWFLLIMEAADNTIAAEIANPNSILRRITNGIHKDPTYTIIFTLIGIKLVRANSTTLIQAKIVDSTFQDRILELYSHEDNEVQNVANNFLTDHCKYIINNLKSHKRNDNAEHDNSNNSYYSASYLIRNLQPYIDLRHRDIQMIILNSQPSLINLSISSINISRDPQPTIDYLSSISHLIYLIQNVGIDKNLKNLVKNAAINGCNEFEQNAAINKLVNSVFPNDFQKSSFTKILLHQNAMVQRMGLILVKVVAQRISRIIPAKNVRKDPKFETALAVCLEEHLPDIQILVNIWNKYFKSDAINEKNNYQLTLVLKSMEAVINIFPSSISDTTFDLLRLLDEIVSWNLKDDAKKCLEITNLINTDIVLDLLHLLRTATLHKRCKWFGTKDDIIKTLTNIIVIEDWGYNIKRDPLSRLLILANCQHRKLKIDACNLFRIVLSQTEIFESSESLEFEMMNEASIWLLSQSTKDNSILLSSTILRIAYHWSANYMIASDELHRRRIDTGYLSSILSILSDDCDLKATPLSAALFCGLSLCSSNFIVLMDYLPNHIKSHLVNMNVSDKVKTGSDDDMFLQKFFTGFQLSLRNHILQIISLCSIRSRSKMSYINEILSTIKGLNINNGDPMFVKIQDLSSLLLLYENYRSDSKHTNSDAKEILLQVCGTSIISNNDASKKRKLKNIETEVVDDFILMNGDSSVTSNVALRLDKLINLTFDEDILISGVWLFVVGLHLTILDDLSLNLLSWIKSCFENTVILMQEVDIKIEQKASFLLQSLEILKKMLVLNVHHNTAKVPKKARSNEEGDSNLKLISQICSILETFAVDLIFSTGCNQTILTPLNSELVISEFKTSSVLGSLIRRILCAASVAQFRKFNIEKKALIIHYIWTNLAKSYDSNTISRDKDLSLFTLGWALQSFLDDERLKIVFVNKIFDVPAGYSALELANQNMVKQSNVRDCGLLISTLGRLSSISSSILVSAQKSNIVKSMVEYLMQPDMKIAQSKLTNSMMGVTLGFESVTLNSYTTSLAQFNFYYDNHLFFDAKLSNDRAAIIYNVAHKFSTIIAQCAFDRMKMNDEQKSSTTFHSILRNICPNVINSSMITVGGIREILEQRSIIAENPSTDIKRMLIELLQSLSPDDYLRGVITLLDDDYISNEIFVTNFIIILLKSSDQLGNYDTKISIAVSFLICILSVMKKENKKITSFLRIFVDTFCDILLNILDETITIISSLQSSDIDSEIDLKKQLPGILQLINLLVFIDLTDSNNSWANNENLKAMSHHLQTKRLSVKKKLNKFVKTSLKWGISKAYVMDNMSSFVSNMQKMNTCMLVWGPLFSPEVEDYYQPQMLLQMTVGHSKFLQVLCKDADPNISIIRLLLQLVSYSVANEWTDDTSSSDEFLVKSLLGVYTGKLTESDRLILRILHIMHQARRCGEICTLELTGLFRKSSTNDLKYAPSSRSWITSVLSQATVYSTLSNFPFWRSLVPQPFVTEGYIGSKSYNDQMIQLTRGILTEWETYEDKDSGSDNDIDDYNSDESSRKADYESDDDDLQSDDSDNPEFDSDDEDNKDNDSLAAEKKTNFKNLRQLLLNHEHEATVFFDHLVDCSDKIYDPSYWLPVLHYSLQQYDLSMRQLSNSGAISLVITSLGSCCPLLRTIALSCLQHILKYLRRQDRTKDAAFRERPQLLLLINFIRNSISYHDKGELADACGDSHICPRLPPTIAVTLGRAAMHLLQPSNDLFSAINKYLLSRPFCDFKDLPMWEMLVMNADVISEQSKRLTELRLIRDGLNSKHDHLNLCRKNGYSKLMMMFPLFIKDSKVSHAILDILDKVLSLQYSARYLVQRCDIIFWLQQVISPFKSLNIESQASIMDNSYNVDEMDTNQEAVSKNLFGTPSYILPRLLGLLRRTIGATYFLTNSNELSNSIYSDINVVVHSILDSISLIDHHGYSSILSVDFLQNLVSCLWELLLTSPVDLQSCNSQISWGIEKIVDLAMIIASDSKRFATKDIKNDFLISTLGLLSFNRFKKFMGSQNLRISDALRLMMATNVDRLGLQANHDDACYYSLLKFSKSIVIDRNPKQRSYFISTLNLFFEDHVETQSNSNPEFHSFVDFGYNMQRCWHEFSHVKLEDMALPTESMDSKTVLTITTKAMLNIISSLINENEETRDLLTILDETIPKSMVRWTLSMGNLLLNSCNYFEIYSEVSHILEKLKNRILSATDNGINVSQYSKSFCEFQLLFQLTLLSIISLEYNCFSDFENNCLNFRRSIIKVLKLLTMSKVEMDYSRETTILLLRDINDGTELWNNSNNRAAIVEICLLVLDLTGAAISFMDKYKSNDCIKEDSLDKFLNYVYNIGPKRLDVLCNSFEMNNNNEIIMDFSFQSAAHENSAQRRLSETNFNRRAFTSNPNKKFRKYIDDAIDISMNI